MPELPEAETIVRGLEPALRERTVQAIQVVRHDVVNDSAERFRQQIEGGRFSGVERRGKNVILVLEGGHRIVVNLGMTGRLLFHAGGGVAPGARHAAVLLTLDNGASLTYDDTRRFGRLTLMSGAAWRGWSRRLGPEPLSRSFSGRQLASGLSRSRTPVRSFLLDQRRIAGVGNIYAAESLWRARIHPKRPAGQLTDRDALRLHRALRAVLRKAIRAGGTTLRDYRNAQGGEGTYGPALLVYGRAGKDCGRCGGTIRRSVFAGRSAYWCPVCQEP